MKNNFPPNNKLHSPLQSFSQEDLGKRLSELIDDRDEALDKISNNSSKKKGYQLEKKYNDLCNQIP